MYKSHLEQYCHYLVKINKKTLKNDIKTKKLLKFLFNVSFSSVQNLKIFKKKKLKETLLHVNND